MRIARGYQRVVTTYQGMYYALKWNERWVAEGVTVYKPARQKPSALMRHRFAIIPKNGKSRKCLRTDRYYVHVYQSKIGPKRRTLWSREIVQTLKRRFGHSYWPREVDKQIESKRLERRGGRSTNQ